MFIGGSTNLTRPHREGPAWGARDVPGVYVLAAHDRGNEAT
jgi:hypothetical protein